MAAISSLKTLMAMTMAAVVATVVVVTFLGDGIRTKTISNFCEPAPISISFTDNSSKRKIDDSRWRPQARKQGQASCPQKWLSFLPESCSSDSPCISFGTGFFGFGWQLEVKPFLQKFRLNFDRACGHGCHFSADPCQAEAVVFNDRDLHETLTRPLPRQPWQRWIWHNRESPMHTLYAGSDLPAKWQHLRHAFNWTVMPMRTPGVTIHGSYGQVVRRSQPLTGQQKFYSPEKKRRLAVAFVSNCFAKNHRMRKLRQLQKLMRVDIFGSCTGKHPPSNSIETTVTQYRFYLSYENSFCKDYITEKYFRSGLQYQAVPVVFGGMSRADYEDVSPPHSFIYALDFPTMPQLAEFLIDLSKDEARYAKYFEWRRNYFVYIPPWLCHVCLQLHRSGRSSGGGGTVDMKSLYVKEDVCRDSGYKYLT